MDLTPRDLGAFAEAVSVGETARDGFGLGDIAMIPAAWEIVDGGARSFGWVVELRRGGRRYLRYRIGSAAKPDVTVTRVPSALVNCFVSSAACAPATPANRMPTTIGVSERFMCFSLSVNDYLRWRLDKRSRATRQYASTT